jgi:hypothetical protein
MQQVMPKGFLALGFLLAISLGGCVRPGDHALGPNCEWAEPEVHRSLDLQDTADQRHLLYDATTAEDLAIRFATEHAGPRSERFAGSLEYRRLMQQCMESLFKGVSDHHDLDLELVREYASRRSFVVDGAVIAAFGALYMLMAYSTAGMIVRRFSSDEIGAVVVTVAVVSLGVSAVSVMLGQLWSIWIEILRVGTGHLSYRTERIPLVQHPAVFFVCGVALFWALAALRYGSCAREGLSRLPINRAG